MEFNKPYPMPKSWLDPKDKDYDPSEGISEMLEKEEQNKENESKSSDYGIVEEEEKRMDIIGQNGNDGLHYNKLDTNQDGIVDKNELLSAIDSLKAKAKEVKKTGDDTRYEIYIRQIQSLEKKLPKDSDNKKNYW